LLKDSTTMDRIKHCKGSPSRLVRAERDNYSMRLALA
jgi:hypothetical protein